jgi:hypothetical protein
MLNIFLVLFAETGQLEVLEWVTEEGCPLTEDACVAGARGGQIPSLQWIREQGCPWDARVCR